MVNGKQVNEWEKFRSLKMVYLFHLTFKFKMLSLCVVGALIRYSEKCDADFL